MPKHINVPGYGVVEFPDGMDDKSIGEAIDQMHSEAAQSYQDRTMKRGGFMASHPKTREALLGAISGLSMTPETDHPVMDLAKSIGEGAVGMVTHPIDTEMNALKGVYNTGMDIAGDIYHGMGSPKVSIGPSGYSASIDPMDIPRLAHGISKGVGIAGNLALMGKGGEAENVIAPRDVGPMIKTGRALGRTVRDFDLMKPFKSVGRNLVQPGADALLTKIENSLKPATAEEAPPPAAPPAASTPPPSSEIPVEPLVGGTKRTGFTSTGEGGANYSAQDLVEFKARNGMSNAPNYPSGPMPAQVKGRAEILDDQAMMQDMEKTLEEDQLNQSREYYKGSKPNYGKTKQDLADEALQRFKMAEEIPE